MKPVSPVIPGHSLPELPFGKNQPEYRVLPAWAASNREGLVVSRWELTWKERLKALFGGSIWLQQLTFKKPLQPIVLSAEPPLDNIRKAIVEGWHPTPAASMPVNKADGGSSFVDIS